MIILAIALGVIGFVLTVTSGIFTYQGRSVEVEPQLLSIPTGHGTTLVLTIVGAVVALAGLIVGIIAV